MCLETLQCSLYDSSFLQRQKRLRSENFFLYNDFFKRLERNFHIKKVKNKSKKLCEKSVTVEYQIRLFSAVEDFGCSRLCCFVTRLSIQPNILKWDQNNIEGTF